MELVKKMPFLSKSKVFTRCDNLKSLLFIIPALLNFGCCIYSFTGAAVEPHLQTIAIPVAEDRSGSGEPNLREFLTLTLTQEFINDNTLQVAEKVNADAVLETTITSMSDAPAVVTSGETVSARRITINVRVVYKDLVKRKTIYDRTFSNSGDYTSAGGIAERRSAIELAIERITEDILLDTVSGW